MSLLSHRTPALVVALFLAGPLAHAQERSPNHMVIEARAQPPAVEAGHLRMGSSASPDGHTIGATSRYLTRDGVPWLPVMGEFHFSRYPEEEWENEILKMKAGGVQIVSTYVIWIHHEEVEGEFEWTGRKNLRRFVELCAKHGMLAYPRIGPWVHAETRNGGLPDWVLQKSGAGVRSNDSTYLSFVERYYAQIGEQLRGLFWKDGGPIIGTQLENEYTAQGPAKGPAHIVSLKSLARSAGFDVPLYTVTGWDGATFPDAEVIPVFGGYMDMPWDQSIERLPPSEVYNFRFPNRTYGGVAAWLPDGTLSHTSQESLARYPFLGAEFGGAVQGTYHRRPVIATDDIAAMLPVQLGAGVNLYGYYMFHGGVNPPGKLTTLMESQRTGYPTDVPVKAYDFQAPLSEYGEMRESFKRLKLVHYFLNAFGQDLAPMVVRAPGRTPANNADTSVLRLSARTLGDRGFLFVNNYLRQYAMPARTGVQVTLDLPGGAVTVPSAPIDVPSGAYFIWPVNLDLAGSRLVYSTAQLFTRVVDRDGTQVYFFFAVPGIVPEFAFDTSSVSALSAPGAKISRAGGRAHVRGALPGTGIAVTVHSKSGQRARIVLLNRARAETAWRGSLAGAERLVLSPQDVFFDGDEMHLRAKGRPAFSVAVFPAMRLAAVGRATLVPTAVDGIFTRYAARLPVRTPMVRVTKARAAALAPPVTTFNAVSWRKVEIALVPSDSAFDLAGRWNISVAPGALRDLSDLFLEIRYAGDIGRLYSGDELLDDDFFDGTPWRVGLKRFAPEIARGALQLRVLPLRRDAPVYIQPEFAPSFQADGQVATVLGVRAIPEYELVVTATVPPR